jgi:hypothetical protein
MANLLTLRIVSTLGTKRKFLNGLCDHMHVQIELGPQLPLPTVARPRGGLQSLCRMFAGTDSGHPYQGHNSLM